LQLQDDQDFDIDDTEQSAKLIEIKEMLENTETMD